MAQCKAKFEYWTQDSVCTVFQCDETAGHTGKHRVYLLDDAARAALTWPEEDTS